MRLFKKKKTPEPVKRIAYAYWEIVVYFKGRADHLTVTYDGDSAEGESLKQFNNLNFDFASGLSYQGASLRTAAQTIEMAYRIKKSGFRET